MQDAIIYIDPDSPMNLQNQVRQKIVDGIINGVFPPQMKLPSSRKLAQQLDVARNTVVAAYLQHKPVDGRSEVTYPGPAELEPLSVSVR